MSSLMGGLKRLFGKIAPPEEMSAGELKEYLKRVDDSRLVHAFIGKTIIIYIYDWKSAETIPHCDKDVDLIDEEFSTSVVRLASAFGVPVDNDDVIKSKLFRFACEMYNTGRQDRIKRPMGKIYAKRLVSA